MHEPSLSSEPIFLIESPAPRDLFQGRTEGEALSKTLELSGLQVSYRLVSDRETLEEAFRLIVAEVKGHPDPTCMPYLHISAHGNADGVELTTGEFIKWEELGGILAETNSQIGPVLLPVGMPQTLSKIILCLSSCMGFGAERVLSAAREPYQCIVGPNEEVTWGEALVGFSTFYHHAMVLGRPIKSAVEAMNCACGSERFIMQTAGPKRWDAIITD